MTSERGSAHGSRDGGLHNRINRILHWDLNVRDLDRSIVFYEALTSFRASNVVREGSGAFQSALLVNTNADAPLPRLNLVQWLDPSPVGTPHDSLGATGFVRIVLHVTDLEGARRKAERLGAVPVAPTTGDDFRFVLGSRGSTAFHAWACLDPDGVVVEFLENPSAKLSVVAQGTTALEQDLRFYTDVLGLDLTDTVETPGPVPNVYLPGGAVVEFSGAFFRVRGDDRGYLDWLEHADRALHRPPYEVAHHVGLIRCTFEVDDLAAAEQTLRAARWRDEPVWVDGPPVDQMFGDPLGRRRVLTFRDPEGVAYQLVQQASYPHAILHPFSSPHRAASPHAKSDRDRRA